MRPFFLYSGHTAADRCIRNSLCHRGAGSGVQGAGDDVLFAQTVGSSQVRQGHGGCQLHFLINIRCPDIKSATENTGESQYIVDLIGIIGPACGNDPHTRCLGILREDLRGGIGTCKNDRIPVLLGTQMVAKGLNLPDVTLVGVLDADLSLYTDSFRAAETTFNMLTQVVGRAGRGDTAGQAVIQTMNPEHRVITLAANQDYESFYELELGMRKLQGCPPFGDIAVVTFTGQDEAAVLRGAVKFRDSLAACMKQPNMSAEQCTVLGPAPCPVPKINYNFRYRLTLRCQMTRPVRLMLAQLLRLFQQDRQHRGVNAWVDVNGFD